MDPLLAQIQDLLAQYLQQGGDTPVAQPAMQLMQAIDSQGGSGMDGAVPPQGGADPMSSPGSMMGGGSPPDEPDVAGMPDEVPEEAPTSSRGGNSDPIGNARAGAKAFLNKKKK